MVVRNWIFLLLSSLLQLGWLVSLRRSDGMTRLAPLALNAVFGFSSTVLLSKSLQGIPISTAYAVWTGVSVAGTVLLDVVAKSGPGPARLACIAVILAGSVTLRLFG